MSKENSATTSLEDQAQRGKRLIISDHFSQSVAAYLQDVQRADILRPYQRDVFEDFQRFFQGGYTRGYIELPTGTGKTVLFVELSKALLSSDANFPRPKILVVTPTKDLVHQTMGRTGERGYGRFAPELRIGSYFSDTPYREKTFAALSELDIVVTTYKSLSILSATNEYRAIKDEDRQKMLKTPFYQEKISIMGLGRVIEDLKETKNIATGRKILDLFDVFILDEAHHAFGSDTSRIVAKLPQDRVIIGFTATPDSSKLKKLSSYLPERIHSLELNEAIWLGLLAPMVPIGIKSGIRIRGSNLYDESGEFIDSRIRYLAEDPARNKLIVEAAKALTLCGIGTIISCIAGDKAWHARYLAEQLIKEGIAAEAVHSGVDSIRRQETYQQFERGKIDVLTFIGVLGEGWDSDRAKAIIGARPTRSLIFSKQRLGRITRPSGISFAIDIFDEYEDKNPPITVSDVLNEGDMQLGRMVGVVEDDIIVRKVISTLEANTQTMPLLQSQYRSYEELLYSLDVLVRGVLYSGDLKKNPVRALASKVSSVYRGVTEEIFAKIEELKGVSISKGLARQGNSMRNVYDVSQARDMLDSLPTVDPKRYFTDEKGVKWISTEGLILLFGKRYPKLTRKIADVQLEQIEHQLDWIPGRFQSAKKRAGYKQFTILKMYNAEEKSIDLLNQSLSEYFNTTPK